MELFRSYQKTLSQISELQDMVKAKGDAEFKELAQSELRDLEPQLQDLAQQLTDYFDPSKNEPDKDIIIEIRAGTGGLEASLPLVPLLRAENWLPRYDLRIDHPEQYFRQYIPVINQGKRLIYVNAFRDEIPGWRQRLVVISDGGACCWQAYYDPAAHTFLLFRINGEA